MGGRLLFAVVFLAPFGCKEGEVEEISPVGIYSGQVTLDDTNRIIVTGVDDAVLTVVFSDCNGDTCAEIVLEGSIQTALGDIGGGTMPVEELELRGRHISGELLYEDSSYAVRGTFSDDSLSLDAKLGGICHVTLDFSPNTGEAE